MVSDIVGYCKVKQTLTKTNYFWGPASDITEQSLPVLEQNRSGDCLCLNPAKTALIDVSACDIETFKLTTKNEKVIDLKNKKGQLL